MLAKHALKSPYKTPLEGPLKPPLKLPLRTGAMRSPRLLCHTQRTMCNIQRLVSHPRHSFKNTLKDSFKDCLKRPLKNLYTLHWWDLPCFCVTFKDKCVRSVYLKVVQSSVSHAENILFVHDTWRWDALDDETAHAACLAADSESCIGRAWISFKAPSKDFSQHSFEGSFKEFLTTLP